MFRDVGQDTKPLIAKIAHSSAGLDLEKLCQKYVDDNEVIGTLYAKSCGIENSWPSLLYLAYKYSPDSKAALLANTNVGGENCHRGSVLGVIMGLGSADGLEDWFSGLQQASIIRQEITRLITQ